MNTKQAGAFSIVKDGKSVFLTGSAGTGKSYLLKHIIKWTHDTHQAIGVTASTGLASLLLKGRTIHSFLGVGLASKPAESLYAVAKRNKALMNKLKRLDVLVIDEISMIDDELFEKISKYLSLVRGNDRPFGGVQVIITGDFCQLPPVNGGLCFQSHAWDEIGLDTVVLTELTRQSDDPEFQKILEEVRWGVCSDESLKILESLKKTEFTDGIIPTRLYATNKDVDHINVVEYEKLMAHKPNHQVYPYRLSSHANAASWVSSLKIPTETNLCVGAQVMVTWNISEHIVNGTRGVVVQLGSDACIIRKTDGELVSIEYVTITCEDDESIYVTCMPLRLAYAISIHKSQGMTLDAVEVDLGGKIFEYGQAYTALSRAKNLKSIRIVNVAKKSFKCHPLVKEFYALKK